MIAYRRSVNGRISYLTSKELQTSKKGKVRSQEMSFEMGTSVECEVNDKLGWTSGTYIKLKLSDTDSIFINSYDLESLLKLAKTMDAKFVKE